MDGVVVDVRGVSKKFCRDLKRSLWYGACDICSELTGRRGDRSSLRKGEFWAAREISFQLARGEAIALVGRNGAGKTTLLRIIAGLVRPDAGMVRTRGRLAPLLALGAGFNPVLSGRENIYVNLSMLGLSARQIRERFDEVVDFAEIGSAIDAPVRTYSSGMTARLGFACAVHVAPEVFIIDEALAVGDATFRGKCFRKLAELRRQGVSLLVVSHNVQVLLSVCDRAVYLRQGEIVTVGLTADVLAPTRGSAKKRSTVPHRSMGPTTRSHGPLARLLVWISWKFASTPRTASPRPGARRKRPRFACAAAAIARSAMPTCSWG